MKNDYTFKLVAALILVGIFAALIDTAHAAEPQANLTNIHAGTYQISHGNGTLNSDKQ